MADESLYQDVNPNSQKKEFIVDNRDMARPPATIHSTPHYDNTTLKPKPRKVVSVEYEELDEQVLPTKGTGAKPFKLVLKTVTYDDGVTIDKTVGIDNPDYQEYLRTGVAFSDKVPTSTRRRAPTKKAKKATAKKEA